MGYCKLYNYGATLYELRYNKSSADHLTPNRGQYLTSPYNITPESIAKVARVNLKLNKFFLSPSKGMCREQYRECAYWC